MLLCKSTDDILIGTTDICSGSPGERERKRVKGEWGGRVGEMKTSTILTTMTLVVAVPYGNHGCACGDVNNAFLYVIDNDGLDTWGNYPFKSRVSG